MKKVKYLFLFILGSFLFVFASCTKQENELDGVVLFNPFEPGNGIELAEIDSVQKLSGSNPSLKVFFHINAQYFESVNDINQVYVYRDAALKFKLNTGNQTSFYDISASPGFTYNYQLELHMNDGSVTKATKPYIVVF